MDFVNDLMIEFDFNQQFEEEEIPCPPRWYKPRTAEIYFEQMCDFEFLRTFRFTKEGVRHLTSLLGNEICLIVSFEHFYL